MPLFDGNLRARGELPVNGRERDGDVKGDFVAVGEDGLGVGADLVADLAGAAEDAVTADDDKVDLTALHEPASGVVGEDLMRDALLRQFPRGER